MTTTHCTAFFFCLEIWVSVCTIEQGADSGPNEVTAADDQLGQYLCASESFWGNVFLDVVCESPQPSIHF